jgi:cysteine synthase
MAVNTTLRREKVVYIDTDGSFSGKRFAAMHARLAGDTSGFNLVAALQHVDLYRVYVLHELLELLQAIHRQLQVLTRRHLSRKAA